MTINSFMNTNMNIHSIVITTETGSHYILHEENGETFFSKSYRLSGKITKLHEEIKIGGSFHIDFYKHDIYNQLQDSTMFLKSSPITSITIR